ncbi:MAG: hypothetical protein GY841_10340 [FCB group bacterium]|nr:hypothetical protein [FCB group bacterium]
MSEQLDWTSETTTLGAIELWERNPKYMPKDRAERLLNSWDEMGQYQTIAVGPDGTCHDGHQRVNVLRAAGRPTDYPVKVLRSNRPLTAAEQERIVIESSVGTVGTLNWDALSGWDAGKLQDWGLDASTLTTWGEQYGELAAFMGAEEEVDYSDFDEELAALDGYEENNIILTVPEMYREQVIDWLSNGESKTAPGLGKGVMRRCGLL